MDKYGGYRIVTINHPKNNMEEISNLVPAPIPKLIAGYLQNKLTPEELNELELWINSSESNTAAFKKVLNVESLENGGKAYHQIDVEAALARAKSNLVFNPAVEKSQPILKNIGFQLIGVAAAVTVILLGIYFFNTKHDAHPYKGETVEVDDVIAGKMGATLNLANGKKITLSDEKAEVIVGDRVTYADGSPVTPIVAGDLTASTANGQTYQITLPDGTRAYLNAASSIQFPARFGREKRSVKITGEVYFEVAKVFSGRKASTPIAIPFIVESQHQQIEVLGTHFNVNDYADEQATRTTLVEGVVRVSTMQTTSHNLRSALLKPNQQSVVTADNRIKVENVNADNEVSWKSGKFIFDGESLESIMRQIARWYDVEVIYADPLPDDLSFLGYVSRSRNLSAVLERMEETGKVKFQIKGRKIIVGR